MSAPSIESQPPEVPVWTLGDRIRKAREHQGWSQWELARRLDVSLRTISRWENDTHRPSAHGIAALAVVTGVPADWILGTAP